MSMRRSHEVTEYLAPHATQADANLNGMHSWYAGSNAHLSTRLGPVGSIFLWLAGLYHQTFDIESFKGEQYWQGTTNHILDSLTDIVSNTFGILVGMLLPRHLAVHAASWLGNYIPGPGEPDVAFGGARMPYGHGPRANDPHRAWGHYPPLRGPGTTRTPLPPGILQVAPPAPRGSRPVPTRPRSSAVTSTNDPSTASVVPRRPRSFRPVPRG
jgi:hypothetical protein